MCRDNARPWLVAGRSGTTLGRGARLAANDWARPREQAVVMGVGLLSPRRFEEADSAGSEQGEGRR